MCHVDTGVTKQEMNRYYSRSLFEKSENISPNKAVLFEGSFIWARVNLTLCNRKHIYTKIQAISITINITISYKWVNSR